MDEQMAANSLDVLSNDYPQEENDSTERSICDPRGDANMPTDMNPEDQTNDASSEALSMPNSAVLAGTAEKRKCDSEDDSPGGKKQTPSQDEKKISLLRKNIRDVMDENQLDTTTLAAQREETERLARVAEQQKIIREYQRQTAVNRQYVRTQNRVLSLLQSENTFAKVTEVSTHDSADNLADINFCGPSAIPKTEEEVSEVKDTLLSPESDIAEVEKKSTMEVVTIDDSSSEDDCILLSDDEDENDIEEETEEDPHNSGLHVKDAYNTPDEQGRVVINVGHPEYDEDIFVAPQIAAVIKPHQIGGVRFLYDNIIESTKRFKTSSGFGCILAHSMGLGKTLQVVCFCDIFLRHTQSKTVLCVMPINTLQNWVSEFNMWTPRFSDNPSEVRPRQFDVFVLNDQQKTLSARAKVIFKWAEEGGVLLIGYELFRLLALKLISTRKRRSNKNITHSSLDSNHNKDLMERIQQALVKPGPDLVICDEGHRIKNANAGISTALKQIRTRRRVVLTGYPLQNNLLEYWCMVDFVRPNYLGTRTEFCNMFERPIQNGQCSDSTPEDIKLMRYRAHVLHSLLVGFVQRRSHVVLQQTLPQKVEFVILTRMTAFQRSLYDTFMNDVVRSKAAPNPLKAFAVCCKIWNHPDVLYSFLKKRETDLDLEIYDAEVSGDAAGAKNKPNDTNATKEVSDVSGNSALTSDIKQPQAPTEPPAINSDCLKPKITECDFTSTETKESKPNVMGQTFNKNINEYLTGNYQRNETTYNPDCNGNSYWQDPSFSYFGYPQMANNMEATSTPSFIGMLSEKQFENDLSNPKESKSSELVDLDTKEINTVAANINLDRNSIAQNGANSFNSNAAVPSQANDDKKLSLENSMEDKTAFLNNDKDMGKAKNDEVIPYEWAVELMKGYEPGLIHNSPKMEIFFCILRESLKLNDRVLLFSQSLLTLNLIENLLQSRQIPESQEFWTRGLSYFRLDGSTTSQEREKLVNEFNSNPNIRLFLISTRAGSLGINLIGANRVIIFDASWNPCHDTQAVYRIYRYGQLKPCFVYRIVMDKCLEKKIYDRQIKKQGMSDRVVDECNPEAHLTLKDVTNLCHDYDDDETKNDEPINETNDLYADVIMDEILHKYKDVLSKQPFHHDSLLVDRKEKKLSQAEKRQAHKGYEMEKKASTKQNFNYSTNKFQYRIVRSDGTVFNRPVASIRPMQSARPTTITKGSGGGARSTRWIPAEVWQRQGMTAQEMTLPLDVVIPTNSSDKSNIVLKAGQRVMVLKSAKGIYMQLDSGKIIAIRTQNKATEPEKTQKPAEIIDITAENDSVADAAPNDAAATAQKDENTTESEGEKEHKNINKNNTEFKTPNAFENSTSVNSGGQFVKSNPSVLKDSKSSEFKSTEQHMQINSPLKYANAQSSSSSSLFATNGNPSSLESTKSHLALDYKSSKLPEKMESPVKHSPEASKAWKKNSQDQQAKSFAGSSSATCAPITRPFIPTESQKPPIGRLDQSRHDSELSERTTAKKHSSLLGSHDVYRKSIDATSPNATAQASNYTQKDSYGNLLYGYNPHTHLRTSNMDYTSHHSLKPTVQSSIQEKNQEKAPQDHSKSQSSTELSNYNNNQSNFNNPETSASFANPQLNVPEQAATSSSSSSTSSNIHYPSREIYSNSHPQYYGNFYDPNTISSTANYPPQFGEYTPYSTYPHPHYRPTFHSNVPNTSTAAAAAALGANPYMPWPPFVPSNTMNEPCNAVYSTSYAQNSTHQYNQWHHQR